MKLLYWLVAIVLAVPLVFLALIYGASELGGEVVVLDRADAAGESSHVRVWIVDEGDNAWIEHGDADAHWIAQLQDDDRVTVERSGMSVDYQGRADPKSHELYHRLRRAKYGWADQMLEMLGGKAADCTGVPVRLEPI